jgi:two-component system, OmpR family, response regulator
MRILIVEDEHRIANTIKKGLEQERYAVDVTYNGQDGYDLTTTEDYDVIILDRMLPGMDGITFCMTLRKNGNHTPVLMLTAKSQIRDRVEGLDSGADDYLTKPFAFEELLARIRSLQRRPKQLLEENLKVRDIELDTKQFRVTRSGRPVQLSSKEFSLLEYLMRNANQIVTKDQIIAHIWDYDADILPNTIEVYIKNLRSKLDAPFPDLAPSIITVRGFGYKME